ncbi:hypothetical protein CYMTET_56091 [Cymbomonas tetramitiformis]|uniref:Uncharacterized protein n=1 Tax=Cymbomonas tetramitiformis TaxID=36881 RepID=A0AAE0BCX0_9CHLO|nr:hypothetical protein CYMTET_56091 [Cymbomonas tetramitiformis]
MKAVMSPSKATAAAVALSMKSEAMANTVAFSMKCATPVRMARPDGEVGGDGKYGRLFEEVRDTGENERRVRDRMERSKAMATAVAFSMKNVSPVTEWSEKIIHELGNIQVDRIDQSLRYQLLAHLSACMHILDIRKQRRVIVVHRQGRGNNAKSEKQKGKKRKAKRQKRAGTEIDLYYKDVKKFKKDNPRQKQFIEDLCFEKVLLEETLPRLEAAEIVSLTFDLWMSHKTEEMFSMFATFLTKDWVPGHCSLGLVKMGSTVGVDVAEQFKPIIAKHNLTKKVVAYVKEDGGNLHTCAEALSGRVSCEVLGLSKPKEGDCLAHAVSKSCGKATLKAVESRCPGIDLDKCNKQLQTCVTYTKKSGPGAGYLVDAQKQNNLPVQRLFTKVLFYCALCSFLDNTIAQRTAQHGTHTATLFSSDHSCGLIY